MSEPSRKITKAVDVRDGWRCVRCGASLQVIAGSRHHRIRRRDGGHSVAQLILLCGSGTTGCHGWVHAHPMNAREVGLIIPALRSPALDPALVPVEYFDGWYLLGEDGTRTRLAQSVALATLADFGMREAA